MTQRRMSLIAFIVILAVCPLAGAVKQVRVTAERASLYIEPSRTSSRIEIVTKGTVLTLLQERKVRDIWYYVSFVSPRYGSRISGFILETMVEPVEETPSPAPTKKEEPPPKTEEPQTKPPEAAAPPKIEEKKEPEAKSEAVRETPAHPPIIETLSFTAPAGKRNLIFPLKAAALQDLPWKVEETPPVQEVKLPAAPPVVAPRPEVKEEKKPETPPAEIKAPAPEKKTEPKPDKSKETSPEKKPEPKAAEPQPVKIPRTSPPRKGPVAIALGLGFGASYGGAGASVQLNTRAGFSLHAGVGLYPTTLIYSDTDWVKNEMMWSVGLKYYLPFSSSSFFPFVDLQYGGLRVEAAQVVIGIWDYQYVLSREQKSLSGPSLLAGIELRKGRFGLTAALGGSYATTSWEYLQNKLSLVFDAGLVLHF